MATRQGVLEARVMKLRNRCICRYVFASTSSASSSPILERDFLEDNNANSNNNTKATNLAYSDGDTQAKIDFIGHSVEKIRLCVISYAGLSNDSDGVVIFLKSCKMIKLIVVDHDTHIESLRRYSLLHGGKKNKIELFKSRSGCVKRST